MAEKMGKNAGKNRWKRPKTGETGREMCVKRVKQVEAGKNG